MKVHELVASFGRAGESANPMDAAHEILESLREEVEAIENSLGYVSGTGGNAGQVFYRSPQITLLKVCFPIGRRTPPHNHGTWATILQLSGEEKKYALPTRKWQAAQSGRDDTDTRRDTAHARRNRSRGSMP